MENRTHTHIYTLALHTDSKML